MDDVITRDEQKPIEDIGMPNVTVPSRRWHSEEIAPGVMLERLFPGGKAGPNGEVGGTTLGGHQWSESIMVGDPAGDFQASLPDIRLPPNQMIPMHWHDCWTAVVIDEGACMIGDWWMKEGDVFVAAPSVEYGPLMIGPEGCRLYEIFAQEHLSPGGYAPEYRGFPTVNARAAFAERSELNSRNAGLAIIPTSGEGQFKGRLAPGARWDMGDPGDPDRGILRYSALKAGERRAAHEYGDWAAIVVRKGSVSVDGRMLKADDSLVIRPKGRVGELVGGPDGVELLELHRTTRA
jgi:hypothetical protein